MMIRILVACIFFIVSLESSATAHEFLLKPRIHDIKNGKKVVVDVLETHIFIAPEEKPVIKDVELFVVQGGKKKLESVSLEEVTEEPALRGSFVIDEDEGVVILGNRKPQYWSQTTEGILEGDRAFLEKQGKKVISVGSYEKYALLSIPGKKTSGVKQYLESFNEQPLIIKPKFDLSTIKAGERLSFTVMLNGRPYVNASVMATYDGFSSKEGPVAIDNLRSDKDGNISFMPKKPGLWIVRTEAKLRATDGIADERNIRSILMFWVY